MEEKLTEIFDTLDISETDRLLEENIQMNLDSAIKKRIKASVYKKSGINIRKRIIFKRLLLTATACMFVFICLCVIGLGDVADAFSRFFGFAPGYGIIENNQS
ncbi:MAG: hypothetical protein Q8942_18910, partial [Bacillota bacterium]|nr:hypothetical protein [Bacillota bacterium]